MGKKMNRHIQMTNNHMKRCPKALVIREMHIKPTVRYHVTPIRMAAIKKKERKKVLVRCGEIGTTDTWECKVQLWKTIQMVPNL